MRSEANSERSYPETVHPETVHPETVRQLPPSGASAKMGNGKLPLFSRFATLEAGRKQGRRWT